MNKKSLFQEHLDSEQDKVSAKIAQILFVPAIIVLLLLSFVGYVIWLWKTPSK